jgi:hypothetical protein
MAQALTALHERWLDAVWVCGGTGDAIPGGLYWSADLLPRRFAAYVLAESGPQIRSIGDLQGKNVGIHPEVAAVVEKHPPRGPQTSGAEHR